MRLPALYLAALLAALAGMTELQLGWRPAFVAVWDARSAIYLNLMFGAPAFFAGLALAGCIPPFSHLKRLCLAPRLIALLFSPLALMGVLKLRLDSGRSEIVTVFVEAAAFSFGLGMCLALIQSFDAESEGQDASIRRGGWERPAFFIATIVAPIVMCFLLLIQPRPRDDGKFNTYVRLGMPDHELTVEVMSPPVMSDKLAVLKITNGDITNALIMEPSELEAATRLWTSARNSQGDSWRAIGETSDTTPSDRATLSIGAGHGVRLTVRSEHSPPATYEVAPADFIRVDKALLNAKQDMAK